MEASNIRPLAILTSYITLALFLSLNIVRSIITRHSQTTTISKTKIASRRNDIFLFSLLAAFSLATTWFYMFSFFTKSYQDWALISHPQTLDLGGWLRDSALFKEAWVVAIGTKTRFWWTQQIFPFTTLWSFFLGVEGHRHKIPSTWKFMLLGQIVAISFATNLFLLSILVSGSQQSSPNSDSNSDFTSDSKEVSESKGVDGDGLTSFLCLQFLILPGLGSAAVLPTVWGTPLFLPTLLIPHLLLFVPPILSDLSFTTSSPSSSGCTTRVIEAIGREKEKLFTTIVVASVVLQGLVTYSAATQSGFAGVLKALYEHPAVSRVGWDVICCWVSWVSWIGFGPDSA